MDVVHLFGLVCPDFPEELVSRVSPFLPTKYRVAYHRRRARAVIVTPVYSKTSSFAQKNDSPFFARSHFLHVLWQQVARILSEGTKHIESRHSENISVSETSSNPTSSATASGTAGESTAVAARGTNDPSSGTSLAGGTDSPGDARGIGDVKTLPFEVFLRACNVYFCFQVCYRLW